MYKDDDKNYYVIGNRVIVESVIINVDKKGKTIKKISRKTYKVNI